MTEGNNISSSRQNVSRPTFKYEKSTDNNGNVVWVATAGSVKYRISDSYGGSNHSVSFRLFVHWPSALPLKQAGQSGLKGSGVDVIVLDVNPPTERAGPEAFVGLTERGSFKRLTPIESQSYPGMLEYRDNSKGHAVWLVSNRADVKTLLGNPFVVNCMEKKQKPSEMCSTSVVLPWGGSVRITVRKKYLGEWHKIFPEMLRQVSAMKEE